MADLASGKPLHTKAVSYELNLKEELKRVHGTDPEKDTVAKYYIFEFVLLLENSGSAVARWVKASVKVEDSRPPLDVFDYEVIGSGRVMDYPKISAEDLHVLRALELHEPDKYYSYSMPTHSLIFRRGQEGLGKWIPSDRNVRATKHVFYGGDDYVSYSRPKGMGNAREGMEELGTFALLIPARVSEDQSKLPLQVICYIESDGFPRKRQELRFEI